MKIIVIGAGSMGKRRIRALRTLGHQVKDIIVVEERLDRVQEIKHLYNVHVVRNFQEISGVGKEDLCIISTPPNFHKKYIDLCIEKKISCFVEATIQSRSDLENTIRNSKKQNVNVIYSNTMMFTEWVKVVTSLINDEIIGEVKFFNYHVGQYLPDWHPWENVNNFYVSKRETGACRELIPFEIAWLQNLFGSCKVNYGLKRRTGNLPLEIDDFYTSILEFNSNIIGNLTIELLSRPTATRKFLAIGTHGKIEYCQDTGVVTYSNLSTKDEIIIKKGTVLKNYINPEEPYLNELELAIQSLKRNDTSLFPNSQKNNLESNLKLIEIDNYE
jgi:predicted dehydrogenase